MKWLKVGKCHLNKLPASKSWEILPFPEESGKLLELQSSATAKGNTNKIHQKQQKSPQNTLINQKKNPQ